MTEKTHLIYAGDPDSVTTALNSASWGYVTFNNGTLKFLICPWCQAMIPSTFDNAHEPGVSTPKLVHIDYHRAVANAVKDALKRFP